MNHVTSAPLGPTVTAMTQRAVSGVLQQGTHRARHQTTHGPVAKILRVPEPLTMGGKAEGDNEPSQDAEGKKAGEINDNPSTGGCKESDGSNPLMVRISKSVEHRRLFLRWIAGIRR